MSQLYDQLNDFLENSVFLKACEEANAIGNEPNPTTFGFRNLSAEEIEALERNGNSSDNWSEVFVKDGFDANWVQQSSFSGKCLIGTLGTKCTVESLGCEKDSGIYHSSLHNCVLGDSCLIYKAGFMANTVIGSNIVIFNVQSITCTGNTKYSVGGKLPLGIETGGREVEIFPGITIEIASEIVNSRKNTELLTRYSEFIAEYGKRVSSNFNSIGNNTQLINLTKLSNVFIGENAVLDSAGVVENSIILSDHEFSSSVKNGATILNSILKYGSEINTLACVQNSVICGYSTVEKHANVADSIIGSNSVIGEGEVTACLIGRFLGAHHQSLLIAAIWPEGKGNVGYGAKIGSNHTGKTANQEIRPGEGTFFGLGCNIKFPSNFSQAPYSIFATGIDTLPQKLEMPFSLINSRSAIVRDLSPAYNEIMPGWVLGYNLYMIKRNEKKYERRNKERKTKLNFAILRPEIIEMMINARNILSSITSERPFYTDVDIPGIGKNYLLNANRKDGIKIYDLHIRYYALRGLFAQIRDGRNIDGIFDTETDHAVWEHQRNLLNQIANDKKEVKSLLEELIEMEETMAYEVQYSKEKDDKRGTRIIPDYLEAHPPAASDPFIIETWEEANRLKGEVKEILSRL